MLFQFWRGLNLFVVSFFFTARSPKHFENISILRTYSRIYRCMKNVMQVVRFLKPFYLWDSSAWNQYVKSGWTKCIFLSSESPEIPRHSKIPSANILFSCDADSLWIRLWLKIFRIASLIYCLLDRVCFQRQTFLVHYVRVSLHRLLSWQRIDLCTQCIKSAYLNNFAGVIFQVF